MALTIYVPLPGCPLEMRAEPGAAIVGDGRPSREGVVVVAVEGRRFGETLASTFADRVERACEQLRAVSSPLKSVPEDDLIDVGVFDAIRGEVRVDYARQAEFLAGWMRVPHVDETELRTTRQVLGDLRRELGTPLKSGGRANGFYKDR